MKVALTKQEQKDIERAGRYLERANRSIVKRLGNFGTDGHPHYYTTAARQYIDALVDFVDKKIDMDEVGGE